MGDHTNEGVDRRYWTGRRTVLKGASAAGLLAATPRFGAIQTAGAETDDGAPSLSVDDRLADRRYVVTGDRAYVVGTQDGRFPAMGWHTRGEMGGVWSPPLKLLDGIWFGIDGEWIGPAEEFTSGYGHARMDLPPHDGVEITRTDFAPDDRRAVLVGLEFDAGDRGRQFTLSVDAHSELTSAYPWGWTEPSQEEFNLEDTADFDGEYLVFRETGTPDVENAETHDWAAVVGSSLEPSGGETGEDFRGPQDPAEICGAEAPEEGTDEPCDDTEFGKGKGGRLRYEVSVDAGETRTVWIAVAGSESGHEDAIAELEAALDDPAGSLASKVDERLALRDRSRIEVPGDPSLAEAIDWSKQNLADSVQEARDLQLRDVDEGQAYPEPAGELDRVRFLGAGFPDYPWLFATDGEYTAYASVAAGQFEPIEEHLRALRDASEIVNEESGKVVHEVVTDGSVYFGTNDDPGNTDETVKFPSAVALLWRWTGDDEFRDEMYDFAVRNMEYVFEELDEDGDLWPEGHGNVEREGMGEEKLDVAAYAIRGLYDLADLARSKGDGRTLQWAQRTADRMFRTFEDAWWIPEAPQHADSLEGPDDDRLHHRHWIGVTPMEIELRRRNQPRPGLTTDEHGNAALDLRETECYGGIGDAGDGGGDGASDEWNEGLYHTGSPGCDLEDFEGSADHTEKQIFTLNSAVMAVGEGNFGRLGPDQQGRFVRANTDLQLEPEEQPGAMPEIASSPDYGSALDVPFTERAMVLQAWGAYGTIWPVVHQWLGVRPDLGRDGVEVTPQVPPDLPGVSGENVRLGEGSIDVVACVEENTYRTTVESNLALKRLVIGHTIPGGACPSAVTLDGRDVDYEIRETNRGREVLVEADANADGARSLVVETES